MKKLLLFVCALFGFMACTQNPIEEQSAIRTDAPETIRVGFEDDETRIQLNSAQKTVWTKDDLVSVFYKSDANQKWEYRGETGERVAELYCVDAGTASSKMNYVVLAYPYSTGYVLSTASGNIEATLPTTQHYAEGSYGVGNNLMVSQSEFTQFSLKSVCGWLKLQLTGDGEVVKSIKFRGNNDEQVAGLIYVDTATAEATLASEMGSSEDNNAGGNLVFDDTILTEVVLDCGEGVTLGAEATPFYISLPPQTFANGFTVEIEDTDGYVMEQSTAKTFVVERNTISPMAALEFVNPTQPTQPTPENNEIWYTNGSTTEATTPCETNVFGANIVSNTYDAAKECWVIKFDGKVTSIGEDAFAECSSLTSVTIPDSVTKIGDSAFYGCFHLTSVTIPDSVTSIGDYAFYYCSSLTSVTIPDSVTTIGDDAFAECSSLESVTIPDSVITIGGSAFSGCHSLQEFKSKFASEDGRCLIIDGTLNAFAPGGLVEYTIPNSVTTIDPGVFGGCESLTSVTIPDSVTEIGNSAFAWCSSLTSVTIPDSVTVIGNAAFANCSNLTSVTIPDSVTSIGYYAFQYCSNLTSVYCKATTPPVGGSSMFSYNASGRKIYVPMESVGAYKSAEYWSEYASDIVGYNFENGAEGTPKPANNEIWYTATEKADPYFDDFLTFGSDVVSNVWDSETKRGIITFDGDVTMIGDDAFNNCDKFTGITLPESVTSIGKKSFYNCDGLTEFIIPDSVTTIGDSAFLSCFHLTSVTIGDSVTTIGEHAFQGCQYLTSVTIPDSVTTIGYEAFCNCRGLTSVTIPDSVTTIGARAFIYCSSLTSVTIPNSVTTIGESAFYECTSLTSVNIPDSVTTIGYKLFYGCSSLTSVTIPYSVTTIGDEAFSHCSSLQEFRGKFASEDGRCLIIDGTLNSFAPAGLTEYAIHDSVTTIGNYTFSGCTSLTSITIPDSVTTIGNGAFQGCNSLTSVTIPDSATTIGTDALRSCSSLTSVTIPDSVTTIGWYAFQYCSSLKKVYCNAAIPPSLGYDAFSYNATGRKIYVYEECVEVYKSNWSSCKDSIYTNGQNCPGTTTIEYTTTDGNTITSSKLPIISNSYDNGVGTMVIAGGIIRIPKDAFRECRSLTSVTIGNGVTTIGNQAFYQCISLTSVTIPDSVTTIGESAFYQCTSLTSVTIPDSVTSIGNQAFTYCDSLTSVTIGDSVTKIGDRAFLYCSSLTSVYCKAITPPVGGSYMFKNNALGRKIYVPMGSVEAYKSAQGWSDYASDIVGYNF